MQVLNRDPRLWGLERSQKGIAASVVCLVQLDPALSHTQFLRGEEPHLPFCRYLGGICPLGKGA